MEGAPCAVGGGSGAAATDVDDERSGGPQLEGNALAVGEALLAQHSTGSNTHEWLLVCYATCMLCDTMLRCYAMRRRLKPASHPSLWLNPASLHSLGRYPAALASVHEYPAAFASVQE